MADWPRTSGSRVITSGTVTLTASVSANTKGSYGNFIGSLPFTTEALIIQALINNEAAYLIDIAVGSAGSEVVLVPDLHYSGRANELLSAIFPISLARTARLSGRIQSSVASATAAVGMQIVVGGFDAPIGRSNTVAYGVDASTSRGTSVDPGSSGSLFTKGAWTQLTAATSYVHQGIFVCIGNQGNPAAADANWRYDIGVGAAGSESVALADLRVATSTANTVGPSPSLTYPCNIPAGSRLSVRSSCNITDATDRLLDFVIYGVT